MSNIESKPLLRGHFHQAMFFIVFGAFIPLIFRLDTVIEAIAITVYAISSLVLFAISSLYHRINWNPRRRLMMRRLDHSGIYLSIAGGFTPVCLLALNKTSGTHLLIIIWAVALFGIIKSFYLTHLPKIFRSIVYLATGIALFPYFSELRTAIGELNFWLIIAGGVVYAFGAMCYGLKRPRLNPRVFSYHELFHICVNLGWLIHFYVISTFIS